MEIRVLGDRITKEKQYILCTEKGEIVSPLSVQGAMPRVLWEVQCTTATGPCCGSPSCYCGDAAEQNWVAAHTCSEEEWAAIKGLLS